MIAALPMRYLFSSPSFILSQWFKYFCRCNSLKAWNHIIKNGISGSSRCGRSQQIDFLATGTRSFREKRKSIPTNLVRLFSLIYFIIRYCGHTVVHYQGEIWSCYFHSSFQILLPFSPFLSEFGHPSHELFPVSIHVENWSEPHFKHFQPNLHPVTEIDASLHELTSPWA